MRASIVIRTLNEARYLGDLLLAVRNQEVGPHEVELVLVDSGSTDATVPIAREFGCVLATIRREEFSFGRSLNLGCEAATGDVLVFISGHCVPTTSSWLLQLCEPVWDGKAEYTYGRQIGGPQSRYSECRIFEKYYPLESRLPQAGIFCNNANSALSRAAWQAHRFDEELTGLEDMELAKRLTAAGGRVGYVAEACVHHYHHEQWAQVKRRFEREALALQKIMPQIHISRVDMVRYIVTSILHDLRHARRQGVAASESAGIVRYRVAQYLGSYRGNHEHRRLSKAQKEHYFYPSNSPHDEHEHSETEHRGAASDEGKQRAGAG